jgi:threonine dehydratase
MAAVEPHLGTAEGPVTAADIERAAELIAGDVRETPVLPAGELSRRVGAPVVLKAECLQLTGSFKVRGVFHKMGRLSPDQLDRGVVAASAGNHAQAVALAADRLNTRADLFMPIEAPLAKLTAVRAYGGKVHLVDGSYDEAGAAARDFSEREGKTLVPAFDDPEIVAGQGSVGLEIARQAPATRLVVVPLGGGGLASGVAIAIKSRVGEAKVIGVQAEACAPYLESLAARRPIGARSASTICDGIAVKRPGDLTLPLVERYLDGIATVSDDEVAEAMVLLLERSKLVVEGAGAAGVAALLGGKIERPADGEICAVLSGGNVDASRLAECIRLGETAAGRRIVLWTVVPDRPGALAALLRLVAEHGANVVDVEHIREGVELHVRETAIELVLQTDGPEHSERIVEAVRAEGFSTRLER